MPYRTYTSWTPRLSDGLYLASKGITIDTGVSKWEDLSGNGYHWTQPIAAAQPTWSATSFNGQAGITFDGANHFLDNHPLITFFNGINHPFTIILAYQYLSIATERYIFMTSDNGGNQFVGMGNMNAYWTAYRQSSSFPSVYGGTTDVNRHTWVLKFDGTTGTEYIDLALPGGTPINNLSLPASFGCIRVRLAASTTTLVPAAYLNCRIAGMIICGYPLSSADRVVAETYLRNACGV